MKYCENCGLELPDAAKFCGKCGKKQDALYVGALAENQNTDATISENESTGLAVEDNFQREENRFVVNIPEVEEEEYTRCPYCMEIIIKGARLCRFCRSNLIDGSVRLHKSKFSMRFVSDMFFILLQLLVIILALTNLITITIELDYGGWYSNNNTDVHFGLGIFSCFDASDFLRTVGSYLSSSDVEAISDLLFALGLLLILATVPMLISLIVRIYDIYSYYKRKGRISLFEHVVVSPIVFVIAMFAEFIFISNYLDSLGVSTLKVGLSSTAVIIIVALCIQIIISLSRSHCLDGS